MVEQLPRGASWQDIPQVIQVRGGGSHVCWSKIEQTIQGYERESGLEIRPDFQRGHVWTQEQQTAFVEFKLRGGMGGENLYFNCPGWEMGGTDDFVLVDGLQRLTAVRRFMADWIPAFGLRSSKFTGVFHMMIHRFVFNINTLQTRAEVLQWYIELNEGGVVHSPEELARVRGLLEAEKTLGERGDRG